MSKVTTEDILQSLSKSTNLETINLYDENYDDTHRIDRGDIKINNSSIDERIGEFEEKPDSALTRFEIDNSLEFIEHHTHSPVGKQYKVRVNWKVGEDETLSEITKKYSHDDQVWNAARRKIFNLVTKGELGTPGVSYKHFPGADSRNIYLMDKGSGARIVLRMNGHSDYDLLAVLDGGHKIKDDDSKKNGSLLDQLVESGIPIEVIKGCPDLWDFLQSADKRDVISKNRNFKLIYRNGDVWNLKVGEDGVNARIEAAANFWLSQYFDFIAQGKFSEPVEAEGFYVTMQRDVGALTERRMPIDYWLYALAAFHTHAEDIMVEHDVEIPIIEYRSVEDQEERFGQVKKRTDLKFDKQRLDEAVNYLNEAQSKTLIHGDTKRANLLGTYLIDLECSGKGHPAADLAMVFMQYGIPKEQWDTHISTYLKARNVQTYFTKELKELRRAVDYAATVVGYREIIGSSLRPMTPDTIKDNQQLVFSLADNA